MKKTLLLFVILIFTIISSNVKAQLSIQGNIIASDNEPLEKAQLMAEGPNDFSLTKDVKSDGSFKIDLPHKGGYYLYLMGIHHKTINMPVIVGERKEVSLNVRMQSIPYKANPDSVYILGDFNEFSTDKGKKLMQKENEGVFSLQMTTDADAISYQLWGIVEDNYGGTYPISGTEKEADISILEKDPWKDGHFATVKQVSGKQQVINFDIKELPESEKEEKIESSDSTLNQIVSIYRDVERKETQLGLAYRDEKKDFTKLLENIQLDYRTQLKNEYNKKLRQLILLRYFDEFYPGDSDSTLAYTLLEEVPSSSPLWSLEARSTFGASNIMFEVGRTSNHQEKVDQYIDEVINQHPDPNVRAQFLYVGFLRAENKDDKKLMSKFYNELKSNYAQTQYYERIRRDFDNNRNVQVGNRIPNFHFIALNDTSTVYSNDFFKNKVYLIDFWGTWCGPCIEELPFLHKAYKKYKDQNFYILSVAIMDERESIKSFRKEQYPMPWHHAFVNQKDTEKVNKLFEMNAIPYPILVNDEGKILAQGDQLQGDRLLKQLKKVFQN